MNIVENDVRALVDKELSAANKRFPQFHSQHEGYAVILEEQEEADRETDHISWELEQAWSEIKRNSKPDLYIMRARDFAINAACEAIQVAAMCQKFLEMENA